MRSLGFTGNEAAPGIMAARKTPATPKARKSSGTETLASVTRERDALRAEVAKLRAKIEAMGKARTQLETRIEAALATLSKLIGK